MKSFFEVDEIKFKMLLMGTKDEMEEEYFYGKEDKSLDDRVHREAVELLGMVFEYVKRFQKAEWTFDKMLECLSVLSHGEILFLCGTGSELHKSLILQELKNGDNKVIPLAVKYLAYYRRAFVSPKDPCRGDFFNIKIQNLFSDSMDSARDYPTAKANVNPEENSLKIDRQYPIRQKRYFDEYMIGQEELKKKLAITVYHHLLKRNPKAFLMIGDTGSGKNHSIHILKQYFKENNIKVPVLIYDASKITPNGFEGDSIKNIFKEYKRQLLSVGGDRGIIYLDEICKIVTPNHDSNGENVNGLIQGQLLSMISGTVIEGVDTSKILFILGGAFADLHTLREKRKNHRLLGFCQEGKEEKEVHSVRDDLISIGMQRELLGRISTIVEMEKLDKAALKQILLHEKIGPIAKKCEEYELDQLEIIIDKNVPDMIVDRIVKQDLGARGAINIVEELFGNYNFDMIENDYQWMHVHSGMLNGEPPIFGKDDKNGKAKRCS